MSDRWFYVPELAAGSLEIAGDEAHHIANVLRLPSGAEVPVFDGQGRVARATLRAANVASVGGHGTRARRERTIPIEIHEVREVAPAARSLRLFVAGCKGPRLTWLVEKCTELGVAEICWTTFARSVVSVDADAIALAGGPTRFAKRHEIVLMRLDPATKKTRRIPLDYEALASGRRLDMNIYVLPGDTIYVP